jgi:hypothetical protein
MVEIIKKAPRATGLVRTIIENARSSRPLPWADLARILRTTPNSIYRTVSRLRAEGRIPRSERQPPAADYAPTHIQPPTQPPEPVPSEEPEALSAPSFFDRPPTAWTADDLEAINALPILSADQRKKLLSAIAMRPGGGLAQASAISKLDEIDKGASSQIGPPPPLTEDQRIERLSRLMRAVGQQTAKKSMEVAFEPDSQTIPASEAQIMPPSGS